MGAKTSNNKSSTTPVTHLVIPDTQIKPHVNLSHMKWAGEFAAQHKPTRIIHIGDGADMCSLSSFDIGTKSFEGRSYKRDIEAFKDGMSMFMSPLYREIKKGKWKPTLDYTLGNHENRINRAIEYDRKLEGLISTDDLGLKEMGWRVHDFLKVITLDGVGYSHYFTSGVMGRPVASARSMLQRKHTSCVMGHVQKTEIDIQYAANGKRLTGLFVGTYYQHKEFYRDPQSNQADFHCLWVLDDVSQGEFVPHIIPMK
ncbi:MAG TPA: hypothetical protein VII99_14715, partial [Bacteroidia bacterium]